MAQGQQEQYVLCEDEEALAVFPTLLECLKWVPNRLIVKENLTIWRFYRDSFGNVERQKITVLSRIFARNLVEFLRKVTPTAPAYDPMDPHIL
jgi:hypothetical protein